MTTLRDKTLGDLGWPRLLEHLAERTHTERGERVARALPLFEHRADAEGRIAETAEARLLFQLGEPLPFGGIREVGELLSRVQKGGVLAAEELVAVAETVLGIASLRRHLGHRQAQAPLLSALTAPVRELVHVSGPILDSIGEGAKLLDHASPALGPLRRKVAELHQELTRRVEGLLQDPAIAPYLQDRFYTQREERYVVPLRTDARSQVKGIVHGTSQSGQTLFVEPEEIVDRNNRLKIAESDVAEEERRILGELSAYVREEVPAIELGLEVATLLDVISAAARLAEALSASAPTIDQPPDGKGQLKLLEVRHPLMVLAGRECVQNDLALAPGQGFILSGPNAGGKTVALKSAGLAALMVRAGLQVPAQVGSVVPWYTTILCDIGDDQSLDRNLSTFSAHLLHIAELVAIADPTSLLLIDELAVGTEPEQGAALAQAALEALADRGAHVIVTTHYERLKALAAADARFVNASVGFDPQAMRPTFRLHVGIPGSSGALALAERMGLPTALVERARDLLGPQNQSLEELLAALASERRRLEDECAAAITVRRAAEVARREAEATLTSVKAREKELRKGLFDEAATAVRRAQHEADQLQTLLRKAQKAQKHEGAPLTEIKATLAELKSGIRAHAPEPAGPEGHPLAPGEAAPGLRVVLPRMGGRGEVVDVLPDGRVLVQLGSLRTTASLADLRRDEAKPRRARPAEMAPRAVERAALPAEDTLADCRTIDNTLDVRGTRVDEALAAFDHFVDDALLVPRQVIYVVHGHGTGALRAAIREHAKLHPAVTRSTPGTGRDGGEGVTLVWLDV
jgi:DNA mismatch repair protein MutS2